MDSMEFLELVLQERLGMLLSGKDTSLPEAAQAVLEAAEAVLGTLSNQERSVLNAQQDLFGERAADHERCAYVGGFCDGMSVLFAFWLYVGQELYKEKILKERGSGSVLTETSGTGSSSTGG